MAAEGKSRMVVVLPDETIKKLKELMVWTTRTQTGALQRMIEDAYDEESRRRTRSPSDVPDMRGLDDGDHGMHRR